MKGLKARQSHMKWDPWVLMPVSLLGQSLLLFPESSFLFLGFFSAVNVIISVILRTATVFLKTSLHIRVTWRALKAADAGSDSERFGFIWSWLQPRHGEF